MVIAFEARPSESPYIEQVWRSSSAAGGPFISVAEGRMELIVSRLPGLTMAALRGPETRPTLLDCPPAGDWFAIRFRPGVHMPQYRTSTLMNLSNVNLPMAEDGSFLIGELRCAELDFENAEKLVDRLVRQGFIVRDDTVSAVVGGGRWPLTDRTVQRHFRRATGMTPGQFQRIERARHATNLLRDGAPILDVVHEAGFYDQAHLTRSVRELIGQTPASIAHGDVQLSFLYKTSR